MGATAEADAQAYPDSLPQPELISLDATALLEATELGAVPTEPTRIKRPVERINGVSLDALERWESGLMTRDMEAKFIDLDVTSAKTLGLVMGDGGDSIYTGTTSIGPRRSCHMEWGS